MKQLINGHLGLHLAFLLISVIDFSISAQPENPCKWNGYFQTRFMSDFDKSTEFIIRRAKVWIYGNVPKANFISYKLQMVYRSYKDESLMFQDVYADIKSKKYGSLRTGRFVPDFMLQRMQPDYEIPLLERADVINSLVHNEKQMAREVGLQYMFQSDSLPVHFSLGVFNANVDKPAHNKDHSLLCTSRVTYAIINQNNIGLRLGVSGAYRHLHQTTLTTIYKADSLISGDDFRWGVETQLHWSNLEVQAEYVKANINKDKASGWYALADYTFRQKYQAVIFVQKYQALNPAINSNPLYGAGLNYKITEKTKLMADLRTQKSANKQNFIGEIQLQVFFN
ncbi:MAG: porin [Bacteroidales bacterium]